MDVFSATLRIRTRPSAWRSSGASPMPTSIASRGRRALGRFPPMLISPAVAGRSPKTTFASSVRPAPTSPASPTTSPARAEKLTSWCQAECSPRTSSTTSPTVRWERVKVSSSSRPTISRTISSSVVVSASRIAITRGTGPAVQVEHQVDRRTHRDAVKPSSTHRRAASAKAPGSRGVDLGRIPAAELGVAAELVAHPSSVELIDRDPECLSLEIVHRLIDARDGGHPYDPVHPVLLTGHRLPQVLDAERIGSLDQRS